MTISSLATAGGTLVLAVATFASVRSAQEAARLNERSLMAGLRPVLTPSREDDPTERIMFGGGHWITLAGHSAVLEEADGHLYMAMSLRNVGQGLAVIHGWHASGAGVISVTIEGAPAQEMVAPEHFRRQHRDLYVPPGDTGFWQGAIRDPEDPDYTALRDAIAGREPITIHLLYGDHEGGQRTVARFTILDGEDGVLQSNVTRYWNLDRDDPR